MEGCRTTETVDLVHHLPQHLDLPGIRMGIQTRGLHRARRCRGTYSGKNDGWTFSPPYFAFRRTLCGTKRPNETAITRFMWDGGYDISISCDPWVRWTYFVCLEGVMLVNRET